MELVDLATTALSLARAEESSRQRMENLFEDCESDEDDCTSEQYAQLAESYEAFGAHAEYLLATEHEATLSARLNTRTGTARKRVGQAITAYVGVPLTLSAILEGRLRFNRWEAIVRRIESLSLPHLRALDVFIVGLDPRYSLGQFTRRVCRFLADLVDKPVLAAKVRSRRTAWVEDLPDGEVDRFHPGTRPTRARMVPGGLCLLRRSVEASIHERGCHSDRQDCCEADRTLQKQGMVLLPECRKQTPQRSWIHPFR